MIVKLLDNEYNIYVIYKYNGHIYCFDDVKFSFKYKFERYSNTIITQYIVQG